MGTPISFRRVSPAGFGAFGDELRQPPWEDIPAPTTPSETSMCPLLVRLKAKLSQGVEGVIEAMGASNRASLPEAEWQRCQSRLACRVAYDECDDSKERRERAKRVRRILLLGNGTGQNVMRADKKVDFGRMQVCQCRPNTSLSEDIAALGYEPLIEDISKASEALAEAVGRRQMSKLVVARSVVIRDAVRKAASTFHWVTRAIDDLLAEVPKHTDEHDRLKKLRASLEQLVERYSVKERTKDDAPHEAEATTPTPAPPDGEPPKLDTCSFGDC